MGALVAVVYLVVHGRFGVRPRNLAWLIAGLGFLGVYLLPFVKYPANPPAIGHSFTISTRGQLYLTMVASSLILLGLAVYLARKLTPRLGVTNAVVLSAVAFLAVYSVLITNILSRPLVIDGKTIAPGQIVYPSFDADVLWKFRWYSIINQLLIWSATALIFGALLERLTGPARPARPATPSREPVRAAS
jgi:Probable cobalt transporter subunit (CbtA)